jgi:carboxypeptidase C (cathepsin A)
MKWTKLFGAVVAISVSFSATPPPRTAVTKHVVHIGGEAIPYTATVAEDIIKDNQGEPGAAVITIAYSRDGITDRARRPVMFIFNGGPGASSSPLHMSGIGPVLRANTKDRISTGLIENTTTPLDVVDLVFIDPVSTGFSRALPGVDPKQWYNGPRDALEVATVIDDWLKLHHREDSPLFLCGESYGAVRAGLIVKYVPQLKFAGVLLVSGGSIAAGPNAGDINRVGAMAAGAWYHNKVERRGLTVQQFYAEAMEFARGDYAGALARGARFPVEERHRVAHRLSTYIGLPEDLIESNDLKIDSKIYMFNLLKDRGLRTGALDTRVTAELKPNADGFIDDPALGVVAPATGAATPTAASVGPVVSPAVGRYISENLQFASTEPYYGVNFTAKSQWNFSTPDGEHEDSTLAILVRAMKADLHLKLFVVSGLYDLQGPDIGAFAQAGVPADRLTIDPFPGAA